MTLQEVTKLVSYIKVNYPNSYKDMSDADLAMLTGTWFKHFKQYEPNEVLSAVDYFISNDRKGYPPTIGNVKGIITDNRHKADIDPEYAWDHVMQNVQGAIQSPRRKFEQLTRMEQRALGTPSNLRSIGRAETQKEREYMKNNFIKRYKRLQEENKKMEALPSSTRQFIENLTMNTAKQLSMDDETEKN